MPRLASAIALVGLALLFPATGAAKPGLCNAGVVQQSLIDAGKLTAEDVGFGVVVDLVRCGDITDDGHADFKRGAVKKRKTAPRPFYRR